jgi:hypothetical protein
MQLFQRRRISGFRTGLLFFIILVPALSWKGPEKIPAPKSLLSSAWKFSVAHPGFVNHIYDSLNLEQFGLSRVIFETALKGWERLRSSGQIFNENILSIVDFSQPSNRKRLYIIDLINSKLLFNTYVAHGRRSGKDIATHFSNRPRSLESSVGFYLTEATYVGSNGYSLRLKGLEYGFNSNASKREIVLHGADYVSEQYINSNGYLGRSWGCPAVPAEESRGIIDSIKEGSCLFIYTPQITYLKRSRILNGRA